MNEKKNILNNPGFKSNPFSVPEDYIESNKLKLFEKLSSENTSIFLTPDDYFITNELKLKEKILSHSDESGLDVPENYFEKSKEEIIEKINQSFSRKKRIIRWSVYLSAAASVLIALWAIHLYFSSSNHNTSLSQPCQTIACLTKQDILEDQQILDEELVGESISDESIEQYFDSKLSTPSMDTNSNELNETF